MTPIEKAKELVSKFNFEHTGQTYILHQTVDESKRCALIAVDEMINSSPSLPILGDGGYLYEDIELSTKYWQEVKQEIQEL
jgi:hypothetical protein